MAQNTDGYRKQINNVNDLPVFDKMYLFAGAPTPDSQPVTSIEYAVLRVSTGVGNFQTCPSMEKFAWVWIAVIPAIWDDINQPPGKKAKK